MIARDCGPRHPPDGTVRADRRSRDPFGPSAARPAEDGCPMPSWCAWRWRRCCWVPGRSITGCGCATGGSGHLFPYLPKQPGYHKRLKAAAPLLAAVIDHLARQSPSWYDPVRLIDATPVPCGASRETVRRSELAGWAHYGYCAAHSRWYWGLKLYLITTPDGMPVAWCLADPKIGEREVAAELLAHAARTGALPAGPDPDRGQGLRGPGVRGPGHRRVPAAPGPPGPRGRGTPPRVHRLDPAVDRIGQRHPQGPARPRTARRPDHRGPVHQDRPAAAGHGRLHLAQLGHRRTRQAVADRL